MILSVPDEGYSRNVPDEGYSRNVPDEGYSRNVPDEGYSRNVPDEGYSRNVPDEGYSRVVGTKCDIYVFITINIRKFFDRLKHIKYIRFHVYSDLLLSS